MTDVRAVWWCVLAAALFLVWAAVPADGQAFHDPGQSDRTVVWTP
jgi:hypothetical protein